MTTPIPRPSDVTHTAVNARALTSVRAAVKDVAGIADHLFHIRRNRAQGSAWLILSSHKGANLT